LFKRQEVQETLKRVWTGQKKNFMFILVVTTAIIIVFAAGALLLPRANSGNDQTPYGDLDDLSISYQSNVKISTGDYEFTFIIVNDGNYTVKAMANCSVTFANYSSVHYSNALVSVEGGDWNLYVVNVDVEMAYFLILGTCNIELLDVV